MPERQPFYVSVKGVIRNKADGKILIVRENQDGRWENPGGRIDPVREVDPGHTLTRGVDLTATLRRELAEELPSTEVTSISPYAIHAAVAEGLVEDELSLLIVYFAVRANVDDRVTVSDELADGALVNEHQYDDYDLFEPDRQAIARELTLKSSSIAPVE